MNKPIKLTKLEDEVLWLFQRRSNIFTVRNVHKLSAEKMAQVIASLSEKLDWPLLNAKDIDNGKFWEAYGHRVPWGER